MIKSTFVSSENLTKHITTFYFRPAQPVAYIPGQFIEIKLPHNHVDDRGDRRWFTLSSSPTEKLLAITTRIHPSSPSSFMRNLSMINPGTEISMQMPMGDFVLPKDESIPLVWVAGGIGCTPFRSMLKYLNDCQQSRDIQMIYATSDSDEVVFRDVFESLEDKFNIIVTGPNGGLSVQHVIEPAKNKETYYYISGPEPMVEQLESSLIQAEIKKSHINCDFFPGYHKI